MPRISSWFSLKRLKTRQQRASEEEEHVEQTPTVLATPGPKQSEQQPKADVVPSKRRWPPTCSDYGFKVVAQGESPIVDIIAIHGVDGHRLHSFSMAKSGKCWLETLLSTSYRRARIVTYGYNATSNGDESQLSSECMYSHGNNLVCKIMQWRSNTATDTRRPIIFIALDIGGIILKHALMIANASNESHLPGNRAMKDATYGLIFLGTPPDGASIDEVKTFLSSILPSQTAPEKHPVLSNLDFNARQMLQQTEEYKNISPEFETRLVYPKDTSGYKSKDQLKSQPISSAEGENGPTIQVATFEKDLVNIGEFQSDTDADYLTLLGWIDEMVQACQTQATPKQSNAGA